MSRGEACRPRDLPPAQIDETARLFGRDHIAIGRGTRIDAFAVITAGPADVQIGERVHIAAGAQLFGTAGVVVEDLVSVSGRVSIYSTSDDFVNGAIAGPLVDDDLRDVHAAPVVIRRHVIVGAGSVILPGVELGWGCTVGALSLVTADVAPGDVVAGVPARVVKRRDLERLQELDRILGARDDDRGDERT